MRAAQSFIGQPIRALQTMLRILSENDPSHPSVIPDGIYGPQTVSAVSAFQRIHGLPVTGVTDRITWDAIVAAHIPALIEVDEAEQIYAVINPNEVIRRGDRHPAVYLAQGMLAVLAQTFQSIGVPSFSGMVDDPTADSLSSFQSLNALPMTGNLDKRTWKHLALQFPLASNLQTRA